jgi:membrane fusion protein, multidrug efflux system
MKKKIFLPAFITLSFVTILVSSALVPTFSYASGESAAPEIPPTLVEASKAKTEYWQSEIQATGSLAAVQGIMVKPEIEGRVTQIFFKSGDYVKAGAPLIETNPDILKAQLSYAKAQYVLSQGDYHRAIALYQRHVLSQADLEKSKAALDSNKANFDKAQSQLNQTLIRAPFAGKLGLRLVNVGDYVSPGQNIVNLQAMDTLRIDFSVPETFFNQLAIGEHVNVHTTAYPNQTFTGTVYAFESAVDPNTRTLSVRAYIPNPQEKLLPGNFVDITLFSGKKTPTVTIPQIAVVTSAEGNYVYKIVNNKAVQTNVSLGERRGDIIAVLQGLNSGDEVITAGQIKIHMDNSPVIVRK